VCYSDVLCKYQIQTYFLRELAENPDMNKAKSEPIIELYKKTQKKYYPRMDFSLAYMVANTYQTQLALAGPNPK
jgi:hypothetical protein